MQFYKMFYYCTFLLLTNIGNSQKFLPNRPFEKIDFPGLTPKWHVVSYDDKLIGDTCDAYNAFSKPLNISDLFFMEDGFIYNLYYRVTPTVKAGTYIEKRSIKDGTLIWRTYYGWPNNEHREYGRKMYINADGNLEIIGNISNLPYGLNQNMYGNHFSQRLYNSLSGELLEFKFKEFSDTSALTLFFGPNFQKEHFSINSSGFSFMHKKQLPNLSYEYYAFQARYDSNVNEIDTFRLISTLNPSDQAPIQINDSLFLLVEFDATNILFRYVNRELNVVKEFLSQGNFEYLILIQKDVERQIYFFADVRGFFSNNRILTYDGEANLLRYTHIPNQNKGAVNVVNWTDPKKSLFFQPRNKKLPNGKSYAALDLLASNDKDSLSIIKTFVATDSLRTVDLIKVIYVNDGNDILVNWRERSSYYDSNGDIQIDDAATAYSLLLFDRSEFEKYLTSVNEISSSRFSIFPNPTAGYFTIEGTDLIDKITILNANGITVFQKYNINNTVEINNFPDGMYFVVIEVKGRIQTHKIVKIETAI